MVKLFLIHTRYSKVEQPSIVACHLCTESVYVDFNALVNLPCFCIFFASARFIMHTYIFREIYIVTQG